MVSLLPAATEIVAALGAKDCLVGVSHECDYPPSVRTVPRVTWTPVDAGQSSGAIDAQVRSLQADGQPAIAIDAAALQELQPTLILTQSLCEVCAVADGEAFRIGELLDPAPQVLAMGGRTLSGVMTDIWRIGDALGLSEAAENLTAGMAGRLATIRPSGQRRTPRVLCLEWLDPPFLAGHWVPELVGIAGGVDVGAEAGSHSRQVTWAELDAIPCDLVIVMLCGFDVARAREEIAHCSEASDWLTKRTVPVWLLDGNAYTSRPGPRLVEGAECIAAILDGENRHGSERLQSSPTLAVDSFDRSAHSR